MPNDLDNMFQFPIINKEWADREFDQHSRMMNHKNDVHTCRSGCVNLAPLMGPRASFPLASIAAPLIIF